MGHEIFSAFGEGDRRAGEDDLNDRKISRNDGQGGKKGDHRGHERGRLAGQARGHQTERGGVLEMPCAHRVPSSASMVPKNLDFKEQVLSISDEVRWFPEFMKVRLKDWVDSLQWDWGISKTKVLCHSDTDMGMC